MKVNELIELLKVIDPTGEKDVYISEGCRFNNTKLDSAVLHELEDGSIVILLD